MLTKEDDHIAYINPFSISILRSFSINLYQLFFNQYKAQKIKVNEVQTKKPLTMARVKRYCENSDQFMLDIFESSEQLRLYFKYHLYRYKNTKGHVRPKNREKRSFGARITYWLQNTIVFEGLVSVNNQLFLGFCYFFKVIGFTYQPTASWKYAYRYKGIKK